MKKKCLSLLLAVIMTLAVMMPLAGVVHAASIPHLRSVYEVGGEQLWEDFAWDNVKISGVTASYNAAQKTAFLSLKDYNTATAFYAQLPSKDWRLFVTVSGSNSLPVRYYNETKSWIGLATNGALYVMPGTGGSTLSIVGNYGSSTAQKALAQNYYALQADEIIVADQLTLNVNFTLNLTGYTTKEVYPFKVNNSKYDATLKNVNCYYNYKSNYPTANPENTRIVLSGSTYFVAYHETANVTNDYAFHSLKYGDEFTGIMHIETTNGYYYGGAYSAESNLAVLGKRYLAQIGNTWKYHVISKNCSFTTHMVSTASLKSMLSFPLEYGYTLPDRVSISGLDAKVKWTVGDDPTDVTGTTAQYGKKYKATVSFVPNSLNEVPTASELVKIGSPAVPTGAYSIGASKSTLNPSIQEDLFVRYNPLVKPALTITKQPVNYEASGSNKQAYFSIEASDPSATYQWQRLNGSTWVDLTDSYTTSGTVKIGGAKGKNLIVNFTALGEDSTTSASFRCKVSRDTTTLYSNTVTYTYTAPTPVVKITELEVGGFNSQPGVADTFYDSPYVLYEGTNANWSGGGDNYKVDLVVHLWYEGEAGATGPTETTDTNFKEGKTYTYRLVIKPVSGKSTFANTMTVKMFGTEIQPTKITKYTDGRWVVDFTFGPIGRVIRNIYLYNVVPPYNGMGHIDPTVREDAGYKLDAGFTKGWYVGGSDNELAGMPQVGKQYYMNVYLYAEDGVEFARLGDKPSASIMEMRDRDGRTIFADKYEYSFFMKNSDGSYNHKYLMIKLTFTCKETHIMKGGTIKDLDKPAPGKALDTEVTMVTPQIDFQEMFYLINGERVDAAKVKPEEGDIIDIVFTFKEYKLGDDTMYFDKNIYTTWWIGGNEDENAVRVYRDTSYPDADVCAFVYRIQLLPGAGPEYTLGDVDGENGVTAADARLALRAAVGLESYAAGSREFLAADVDLSDSLTAADARLILRKAVGFNDAEWGVKKS